MDFDSDGGDASSQNQMLISENTQEASAAWACFYDAKVELVHWINQSS